MTDNYESRLRARLGALERSVPVSGEAARAGRTIHRGMRVRSALPVGSLAAVGLAALVVVGLAPRLAPAGVGAGASPSVLSAVSTGASSSTAATNTGTPSPSASLVLASPMAPIRPSSISKIDWTTVPLPAGVDVDTTTGNNTAHAEPVVAGLGGNLIMLSSGGVFSLNLTAHKWTKLAGPKAFDGYVPSFGLIEDGRGGLMAFGHDGVFRSRDGRTWQKTLPVDGNEIEIMHLTVTPTGYLAVAAGPDNSTVAFTSADGAAWTRQNLPDAASWFPTQAFVWNGKLAIGAAWVDPKGEEGKTPLRPTRVWLSSDGTSWETRSVLTGFVLPRFLSLGDVTVAYEGITSPYNKGIPISYFNPRQGPVSSTDLAGWHRVTVAPASGFTSGVVDIEPFGSGLIAANSDGSVATSGDGVSWKLQASSGPSGWLNEGSLETLSKVGDSVVYTNAKLPSGKPGLLILTPVE